MKKIIYIYFGKDREMAKDSKVDFIFSHIIETDEAGQTMFAIMNLSAMRSMYDIDKTLTEDEAIAKL